ncbi:DUF2914 domain-containing protein [Geopsychrobacter electrodiphilus]|uniref:DUF2914 domain-containing protein n=1 Tax=Geopsychrobacter electrodiphilus TaxID=225196 RepID=UPI00039BF98F|nr:DUF2914 domain-containing protein [Geopsychrobacter electrodiphilus]
MGIKTLYQQHEARLTAIRRFLPGLAFISGFTWDSVSMGRVVSFYDLLILTTYYFGAGLILVLLVREIQPRWQNWFTFLIQFFFGSLFSALVVFYFKSSGSLYTFLVVIFLALMLVSNEFIAERYRSRTLTWTMFAACGTMYLNFLIPHVVHSIKPVWFYLSCIFSLTVVFAIHGFAYAKQRESMTIETKRLQYLRELLQMAPSLAVVALLVVLYQFQLIPPVPLVLKESYICKDFSSENGVYQCQAERQSLARALGFGGDVIHITKGEKIYNLSAVFAPTRITVDLEQRWWLWNEQLGSWLASGVVPLPMVGGRKNGWRTYSYIQASTQAGDWKVETALKDGAVLAVAYFTAKDQVEPAPRTHAVRVL